MKTGQCFVYHYSDGSRKGFFFTGIKEQENGETIFVMCEMLPADKINPKTSFWRMAENYYNQKLADGTIELI